MDQHQGAIVDHEGRLVLNLHVSLRVSGAKWKGVLESPVPVPADARPVQDHYYRLRLADGQEKTIHLGPVTPFPLHHGLSFRATFTSSGPPPAPPAAVERPPG